MAWLIDSLSCLCCLFSLLYKSNSVPSIHSVRFSSDEYFSCVALASLAAWTLCRVICVTDPTPFWVRFLTVQWLVNGPERPMARNYRLLVQLFGNCEDHIALLKLRECDSFNTVHSTQIIDSSVQCISKILLVHCSNFRCKSLPILVIVQCFDMLVERQEGHPACKNTCGSSPLLRSKLVKQKLNACVSVSVWWLVSWMNQPVSNQNICSALA